MLRWLGLQRRWPLGVSGKRIDWLWLSDPDHSGRTDRNGYSYTGLNDRGRTVDVAALRSTPLLILVMLIQKVLYVFGLNVHCTQPQMLVVRSVRCFVLRGFVTNKHTNYVVVVDYKRCSRVSCDCVIRLLHEHERSVYDRSGKCRSRSTVVLGTVTRHDCKLSGLSVGKQPM